MPFKISKMGENRYMLYKLKEKQYAKPVFKSRQSAINAGIAWMKYHRENPYVSGDYILSKKSQK